MPFHLLLIMEKHVQSLKVCRVFKFLFIGHIFFKSVLIPLRSKSLEIQYYILTLISYLASNFIELCWIN